MNKAIVSEDSLNAVMGYLGTRPYQEVFQLIKDIQATAKPFVEPDESNPVDTSAE
jgi:hypothetical protein